MSKDVGNIFGVAFESTQSVASAVFNFFDQYRFRRKDTWPKPVSTTTGGTISTPGNGYKYHTFTSPGTLTVADTPAIVDILIVAGGGGAGAPLGAGGGAGGLVHYTNAPLPISPGSYPVVVGAGGAGATGPGTPGSANTSGSQGSDSSFNAIVAKGGGGGWPYGPDPGSPTLPAGGSGGGAPTAGPGTQPSQNSPYVPLSGFAQYGFPGGTPSAGGNTGGGGGGAGEAGNTDGQGAGGDGRQIPAFSGPLLAPTVVTPLAPLSSYYAGGGAGGGYLPSAALPGGLGGGGNGAPAPGLPLDYGNAGVQYSGGGAASGDYFSLRGGSTASAGGSGIVVIRLAV